ncbi:hypothetical protein BD560DRAFT_54640 [Blakeslea trispora]|nr:hypothetical protein BD560DRAFT_54640 [Blakeslea trispora]
MNISLAKEEQKKHCIDSLQAAINKFSKQEALMLSEDVLDWHSLCRLEEEAMLLEEEDKRFVRNLVKKLVFRSYAVKRKKNYKKECPFDLRLISLQKKKKIEMHFFSFFFLFIVYRQWDKYQVRRELLYKTRQTSECSSCGRCCTFYNSLTLEKAFLEFLLIMNSTNLVNEFDELKEGNSQSILNSSIWSALLYCW